LTLNLQKAYDLTVDPSNLFCNNATVLTEIAMNVDDPEVAFAFAKEIKYLLFLTLRSEKNPNSCWCLTTKQHVSLICHSLVSIVKMYQTESLVKLLFNCLESTNGGNPAILLPNDIPFSNATQSPFDDLSVDLVREYENVPTIREDFNSKVRSSIFHFCVHSDEKMAISILNNLTTCGNSSFDVVEVLELTLIALFNNTEEEFPKKLAMESFNIYDDAYSPYITSLLEVFHFLIYFLELFEKKKCSFIDCFIIKDCPISSRN
jgi:hypothetical protein